MFKTFLPMFRTFEHCVIGMYLGFGACDLVLSISVSDPALLIAVGASGERERGRGELKMENGESRIVD